MFALTAAPKVAASTPAPAIPSTSVAVPQAPASAPAYLTSGGYVPPSSKVAEALGLPTAPDQPEYAGCIVVRDHCGCFTLNGKKVIVDQSVCVPSAGRSDTPKALVIPDPVPPTPATVAADDKLYIYKIDRFARSLIDLLNIVQKIEAAGASFQSLTEPIDTSSGAGRMMVHMLGAFAEFERGIIRERCMAGQSAAMERGVHCGRPRSLDPDVEADIVRLYQSRWYTLNSLALAFDCHPSTVKRAVYRVLKPGHSSLQ